MDVFAINEFIQNNKFQILAKIGQGGYSVVYKANQYNPDNSEFIRVVAIKVIFVKNQKEADLVYDELRISNLIKNADPSSKKHIVDYYEYFELGSFETNDKAICMVIEYLNGITLRDFLNQNKSISYIKAIEFIKQIAHGIMLFHESEPSVIHRDLKPENCMIDLQTETIKIFDYGISSVYYDQMKITTIDHDIKCTVPYAPPTILNLYKELTKRKKNNSSFTYKDQLFKDVYNKHYDLHSLGVMLYELITNQYPFLKFVDEKSSDEAKMRAWYNYDYKPLSLSNPTIPIGIDNILIRCFAWKNDDRCLQYVNVKQFLADLELVKANDLIINQELIKPFNKMVFESADEIKLHSIKNEHYPWYLKKWVVLLTVISLSALALILLIVIILKAVGRI